MTRPQKRAADIGLAAISVEGGLIAPEQLAVIAAATPDLKTAAEYGCPKGTSLRDEITRYFRIGQAHWQGYARIESPTVTQTAAFVKALLEEAFGFALTGPHTHSRDDHRFRIAWEAKGGRVPIVVAAPIEGGEAFTKSLPEFGDGAEGRSARRSPAILLQDWLNANPEFYWGLVFAGDRVRLMRDNASFTRPAYVEADIGAIFRDEMFADFTALWLLIHASRFGAEDAGPSDCALERWREAGQRAGTAARDRLRGNVEDALTALGQGFLDGNPTLRGRLDDGSLTMQAWFEQLLRLVYRMIFLAVAEDRDLLHPPSATKAATELYANGYGFAYLRDRAAKRSSHDHHHDAWEGAKIVLRALEQGEKQLGLPALGGLFARGLTPDLDAATLPNRNFLTAIFRLSWLIDEGRRVRINWRDMATEELGSVYEGLLELVPVRGDDGRSFAFAGGAEAKGNARKISGSYYTPDSLVQTLLDSALDPVLQRAEDEGGVNAILALDVIDPACGSGHFLLGAARRMATRVAQIRANADGTDAPDYARAMRDVARNCIHGVDRNPMAVELAKVALWIETVEPGKPLGFLDTNLVCGDSLLGIFDLKALEDGIPDDAYKPLTGDDKETAVWFRKKNKAEREGQASFDWAAGGGGGLPPAKLAADMEHLRDLPEDTVADIETKRSRFAAWVQDPKRYATKVACDLYVAAFLTAKRGGVPTNANCAMIPTTAAVRAKLSGANIYGPLEAAAVDVAARSRALHWPLTFPEVMVGKGGFDVVIGNPPWERIKLQEVEFFSSRNEAIAVAPTASKRKAMVEALSAANQDSADYALFKDFQFNKRVIEASALFCKYSGRFPRSTVGDFNTYALFTEFSLGLVSDAGASGLIVPSGIATESATSDFFGYMSAQGLIKSFFDFENRSGFFRGLHTKHKFSALTMVKNRQSSIDLCFFAYDIHDLLNNEKRIKLSEVDVHLFNPNTNTLPILRTKLDFNLLKKIYTNSSVLINSQNNENPWSVKFLGMFHMTLDSGIFEEHQTYSNSPLYEAKMFWHFDHRWANATESSGNSISSEMKLDHDLPARSRYFVPNDAIENKLVSRNWEKGWLIAYRNISDSRNERTFVSSIIPRFGVGNSATVIAIDDAHVKSACCFLANCNSIIFDYAVRQKIPAMNVNAFMVEQFPFLTPNHYSSSDIGFITERVVELVFTAHDLQSFATEFGYTGPPFSWNDDRRALLRAELDAWFAHAYGLSRDELRYVLDPKDVMGEDYPSETFRVLQKNEIAKYGEYRTARLVLAAYDALSAAAPQTAAIADGNWQGTISDEADVRLLLAAILKRMRQPRYASAVRAAFLYAAQPHLLMPHLNAGAQAEWRRLVGVAASLPVSQTVPTLSSAQLTHFGTAQANLAGRQVWRYDAVTDLVDRGAAIYDIVLPQWAEGRADFVWHALRMIDLSSTAVTATLSQWEQDFVAQSAAA